MFRSYSITAAACVVLMAGCSSNQSPPVSASIQKALNQAGLKQISVAQDRDKGLVTLTGKAPTSDAKAQAASIAQGLAAGQVVANEIAVIPPNAAGDTKTLYADLDKGIESNLDAALIQNRIPGAIRHTCTNGVVTLLGTVDSENSRQQAEQVASAVPNVQQVVNELQIKDQKATSNK